MGLAIGEKVFKIPDGFTGVVREIEFFANEVFYTRSQFGTKITPIKMDVFVNGIGVNQMTNIELKLGGSRSNFPCFFLVPVGGEIKVRLSADIASLSANQGFDVDLMLHTNFLLSDGGPLPFTVGTKEQLKRDSSGMPIYDRNRKAGL